MRADELDMEREYAEWKAGVLGRWQAAMHATRCETLLREIRAGAYGCWTAQLDAAITDTLGDG